MLRRTFCVLAAATAVSSAAWAQDSKPLNFGIISTESSTNLKQAWQPLIDDLSKAVGVPVKPFFASDYAGLIAGMRLTTVQLRWFVNNSAMEPVDRAKGEVFASVCAKDVTPRYGLVLLFNKVINLKPPERV